MERLSSVPLAALPASRRQQLCAHLKSGAVSLADLNTALLQAADTGHQYLLHILIDTGATNLVGAMTRAGSSGHLHIVDALVLQSKPVPFSAAFVGALVGLRKDVVDYVVSVADKQGLDNCLLLGAARIWSCRTPEEVTFLQYAMESMVKAGARDFERALQVSCSDAVIGHWNGNVFKDKAKILQRILVLGSRNLSAEFIGGILLMICVTFLCKLMNSGGTRTTATMTGGSKGKQVGTMMSDSTTADIRCPGAVVQDMINILSVVCQYGAAEKINSCRLLDFTQMNMDSVRSLLHVLPCLHQPAGASGDCATCSAQWPLKVMKFLLLECGIRELGGRVTLLAAFQAARHSKVLLPVVRCFLEQKCFDAFPRYLDMSITFCQGDAIQYLLSVLPRPIDTARVVNAVRIAASDTRGAPLGPEGVLFALHANFLEDTEATLAEATALADLAHTDALVKKRLKQEWSLEAFQAGTQAGQQHFLNCMLVRKRSCCWLRVGDLPLELQVAIAYLPLYRDCSRTPGSLLSERQRGELVTALCYLYQGSTMVTEAEVLEADKRTLLRLLSVRLPDWCRDVGGSDDGASVRAFFRYG